jgi:hypothetical protein
MDSAQLQEELQRLQNLLLAQQARIDNFETAPPRSASLDDNVNVKTTKPDTFHGARSKL